MAATLDEQSGGRLAINIITGTDEGSRAFGNYLDKDERYEQRNEYWDVFRA